MEQKRSTKHQREYNGRERSHSLQIKILHEFSKAKSHFVVRLPRENDHQEKNPSPIPMCDHS